MQILDYAIVALYLGAIVALGFYLAPKASNSHEDYVIGDRQLPWWVLGASGMASNTDIAGTMMISALVYALGTRGFYIELRGGIVLVMAFFMVFMGKWMRRSQKLTIADWMIFRFGEGKEGNIARIMSAVANIVFAIGAMSYFSVAGGKFIGSLVGIDDRWASIVLVAIAGIYTVIGGFYAVVWTDVFQGVMIFVAVIYICAIALHTVTLPGSFEVALPDQGGFLSHTWSFQEWSQILPPAQADLPGDYGIYNLFGGVIFFYFLKTTIEGCSGGGGYMAQRYFAAKSDRDAGLLSLFWIVLMSFRFPLVAAFAVLGIDYGLHHGVINDPELILPIVIANYIPVGLKGLLIACFIAAAMSTFDSIINSTAAYWSNDLYKAYINPQASQKQLLGQSRLASVGIIVVGLFLSFNFTNINDIWGWLTLGLGVGLSIPLVLRWYWYRFNGYGFALGTFSGMVAAILTKALVLPSISHPPSQEYVLFGIPAIASLLGCVIGSLVTPPTDHEVIRHFHHVTKPFGFWGRVTDDFTPVQKAKLRKEHINDVKGILVAVPWQLCLFLLGLMVMMQNWANVRSLAFVVLLLSIALYFTWYRHLDTHERPLGEEDLEG